MAPEPWPDIRPKPRNAQEYVILPETQDRHPQVCPSTFDRLPNLFQTVHRKLSFIGKRPLHVQPTELDRGPPHRPYSASWASVILPGCRSTARSHRIPCRAIKEGSRRPTTARVSMVQVLIQFRKILGRRWWRMYELMRAPVFLTAA